MERERENEYLNDMANKENVSRNIGLTFDFVNYLIDNPDVTENLPDFFKLEFIEKDFPFIEKRDRLPSDEIISRRYVKVKNTFELAKQE